MLNLESAQERLDDLIINGGMLVKDVKEAQAWIDMMMVHQGECSCHINPPCGYCESMPEIFIDMVG
jgi:hypothetical protein